MSHCIPLNPVPFCQILLHPESYNFAYPWRVIWNMDHMFTVNKNLWGIFHKFHFAFCMTGSFHTKKGKASRCIITVFFCLDGLIWNLKHFSTVSPLYTDTRYNDKVCYNDNLNVKKPSLKRWWLLRNYAKTLHKIFKQYMVWIFVRIASYVLWGNKNKTRPFLHMILSI